MRLFGDGSSLDATLLDQKMPGLDGLETLRRMKQRRADACIIMVTAYATIELAVDAMKLGATDFVRKPMTPDTLRHAVAAALSKRETASADATCRPAERRRPCRHLSHRRDLDDEWVLHSPEPNAHVCVRGSAIERAPFRRQARPETLPAPRSSSRSTRRRCSKIARECGKDLGGSGSFWHRQAENALVNYLWSEAALPEGGRLVITRVSASDAR